MPDGTDWHPFDVQAGYDVRRVEDDAWEIRDADGKVTTLTDAEFEQLRAEGPNPKGL